jgi:hypothetical protein
MLFVPRLTWRVSVEYSRKFELFCKDHSGCDHMIVELIQSKSITGKVVILIPAYGKLYSLQHYVIKAYILFELQCIRYL